MDKLVVQENKDRREGDKLSLETIIRKQLGERMEDLSQGFFGPKDRNLYGVGRAMRAD